MWGFVEGRTYNRRREIHGRFGGQQQGGIITPGSHPVVICITGPAGHQYGYEDRWLPEGVFRYFGEGQKGDMEFVRGNRAIRDHTINGKDLLLFEKAGGGDVRFVGPFLCAGFEWVQTPDVDGSLRQSIGFNLVKDEATDQLEEDAAVQAVQIEGAGDIAALRARAYSVDINAPSTAAKSLTEVRVRSAVVKAYVLARADGRCESCGEPAPFRRRDGTPYLEPHHIRRLSDGGPDHPAYVGAICPNCHREIHSGANGTAKNEALQEIVSGKELAVG